MAPQNKPCRRRQLTAPRAVLQTSDEVMRALQAAGALASMAGYLWLIGRQAGINFDDFNVLKLVQKLMRQPAKSEVTFADVAGVDDAKFELQEIVDFLKNAERYKKVGAKIPKGCLLVGPPGTGKTLLAKAVAGEAGVPFFYKNASQFVEIFVGTGAKRVRELFAEARRNSPCIIFIDEIDAVGGERTGALGGNDERAQTLNQLLGEMDGFGSDSKVVVIAATNRPDMLDPALLRPGRFDRHIVVGPPDLAGREAILATHARGRKLKDVDFHAIALLTVGFSGADLANLVNEASIRAARDGAEAIEQKHFLRAFERIIMGGEARKISANPKVVRLTSVHESGHAILATLLPKAMPVRMVTIAGQGTSGGATHFIPTEEQAANFARSKQALKDDLVISLGGRLAEEIILGDGNQTTGAVADIHHATRLARDMVTRYGLSDQVGPIMLDDPRERETWLSQAGDELKTRVDNAVVDLVREAETRARTILQKNRVVLEGVAAVLAERGTLEGDELRELIKHLQRLAFHSDP